MILVDMHGEATSEKTAIAHYFDGKVTAVVGTHTHVPTCDHRVLPGGTAYCSDLGMTGPYDSVIGVEKDARDPALPDRHAQPLRDGQGRPALRRGRGGRRRADGTGPRRSTGCCWARTTSSGSKPGYTLGVPARPAKRAARRSAGIRLRRPADRALRRGPRAQGGGLEPPARAGPARPAPRAAPSAGRCGRCSARRASPPPSRCCGACSAAASRTRRSSRPRAASTTCGGSRSERGKRDDPRALVVRGHHRAAPARDAADRAGPAGLPRPARLGRRARDLEPARGHRRLRRGARLARGQGRARRSGARRASSAT